MKIKVLLAILAITVSMSVQINVMDAAGDITKMDYTNVAGKITFTLNKTSSLVFNKKDMLASATDENDVAFDATTITGGFETNVEVYAQDENNFYELYFFNNGERQRLWRFLKKDCK